VQPLSWRRRQNIAMGCGWLMMVGLSQWDAAVFPSCSMYVFEQHVAPTWPTCSNSL
jgi:hypothetical protein